MSDSRTKTGWVVTLSGTGINLALGVLYAWSVIVSAMPESWNWTNADKALPYAIACFCFALAMVPAGRLQDKIGPRWVATMGGVLTGSGFIFAGLMGSSLMGFVLGFGILAGLGIGFGYASATPPALKWFPPEKTGMIAGIVVAGFGLASVYIAPLANWLLDKFAFTVVDAATNTSVVEKGVSSTMIVLGLGFLVVVVGLAQMLKNPPSAPTTSKSTSVASNDKTVKEMLSGVQFYILWFMFFAGAGAGLAFISVAASLGKRSLGELAFVAVVVLAIGNAGGRIVAGMVSDKIGRQWTLFICFVLQAVTIAALYFLQGGGSWVIVLLILLSIGANYGANLALFPSVTKDLYGLKNYGLNYGVLFTSWGVSGLAMSWMTGFIKDVTGKNDLAYLIIIAMLLAAAALTFVSRSLAQKKTV